MIEMAEMEPPNSDMSPMRVLIKIQKSDPPKLRNARGYSREFSDFLAKCLVKNPNGRLAATDLLSHPFIRNAGSDRKPILDLLSEAGAEIYEERIEEDIEDDRRSYDSEMTIEGGDSEPNMSANFDSSTNSTRRRPSEESGGVVAMDLPPATPAVQPVPPKSSPSPPPVPPHSTVVPSRERDMEVSGAPVKTRREYL